MERVSSWMVPRVRTFGEAPRNRAIRRYRTSQGAPLDNVFGVKLRCIDNHLSPKSPDSQCVYKVYYFTARFPKRVTSSTTRIHDDAIAASVQRHGAGRRSFIRIVKGLEFLGSPQPAAM